MFLSMPTLFVTLKTAAKLNPDSRPPYIVEMPCIPPQHMVAFLSLKIVLTPQGMKNPRFSNRGFTLLCVVLVCLHEHGPAGRYSEVFCQIVACPWKASLRKHFSYCNTAGALPSRFFPGIFICNIKESFVYLFASQINTSPLIQMSD